MQIVTKSKLEAEDVRELAEELLRKQLSSFQTEGYKITTSMALNVMMKAAVERRSIEAVCGDLEGVVDANTLREAVNRSLKVKDLRQHETEFNAALGECIPHRCPGRAWRWQLTSTANRSMEKRRGCGTIPVEERPTTGRPTSGALPVCTSSGALCALRWL